MIDKRKAQEPIDFIECLHLVGDFTGQPFLLQDWQKEILRDLYGELEENGLRKYSYLYLEVPKKNGKTPLVAAIGLYHLVCDPPGGEIYCAAAERDQAAQTYRYMKSMIEQDEDLSQMLRVVDSKKEIYNDATGTFVKVLSAEAYSKHGMAPSVIIVDELHAHQKRDLWDYLTFGAGAARKQPLWLTITTAGDDPDRKSIGWEIHEQARKIRDGELIDPTWLVKIYAAPESADIYDEATWYAANPSLGVAIDIDKVRKEAQSAKNNPKTEKLFRWLRLNQWVQLKKISWLPITLWDETEKTWNANDLIGKRCYVGIDLARWIDLTGIVCLFPPQEGLGGWRFIIDSWIPENTMSEHVKRDGVDYERWAEEGYLNVTQGDTIDYQCIKRHIEKIEKLYSVEYYCGDPWHLEILKQLLNPEIAKRFIEIPQTIAGMSPGMSELERQFKAGEISHLKQPLGRYCFGCVIVNPDGNENIKPMKNKSVGRIDPIVALINAMNGAINLEPVRSVYETRGLRSLA